MRDLAETAVAAGTVRFDGARVMLRDEIVETSVLVADGVITEVGSTAQADRVVDARGLILAPALIDVHGDAFERQIMPRPNVFFPMETAVLETDRQLAANGIATAYHSLTLSWEPGLRSVARGREMMQAIRNLSHRLTVENRIQLRWETFAFEALETLDWAFDAPLTPSLAFNDHLSMAMRSFDTRIQDRLFEHNPAYATVDPADPALPQKRWARVAQRAGLPLDDFMALMASVWARRPQVVETLKAVAEKARTKGVPMLSHDDTQVETRAFYRNIGATTAEFPMTIGPARDARGNGDLIIFGAPNAVRGGSHIGSLGAGDMVEAGLCDMLASDYYYPALLAAVARLDAEKRATRPALWQLVSSGPAQAMKLEDRGVIAAGKRADLVLVDWPEGGAPAIRMTMVAGRMAYQAAPLGAVA